MAKKTDNEILAYAEKICKQLVADSPSKRAESCANKSHSKDRYCNTSTHTSCQRCKWFTPTTFAKIKYLVAYIDGLQTDISRLNRQIKNLNEDLTVEKERVLYLKEELLEHFEPEESEEVEEPEPKEQPKFELNDEMKKRQHELAEEMRRSLEENGQITDGKESEKDSNGKIDVAGEVG